LAEPEETGSVLAALGAPSLKAGETAAIDDEVRVCHHGNLDYGRTWITAWGRPARLAQWLERALPNAQATSWERLEGWRLGALRPRVDAELDATTIPLEAGLVDALAQAKGCYPGQEVIERIISLGSPARRLVQIVGEGNAPAKGEKLHNLAEPPIEVGQVTSVAKSESGTGFTALAFVRKIHAKEGLEVRFADSGSQGAIARVSPYA
jgi:folate-binding protein YgfZ